MLTLANGLLAVVGRDTLFCVGATAIVVPFAELFSICIVCFPLRGWIWGILSTKLGGGWSQSGHDGWTVLKGLNFLG